MSGLHQDDQGASEREAPTTRARKAITLRTWSPARRLLMPAPLADWHGSVLFRHLVQRLDPTHPFVDLNVHNIWALLAIRRGLTLDNPAESRPLLKRSTRSWTATASLHNPGRN